MTDDKTLQDLHEEVAKDLLKKIKSGEATAQELNAAIKFLQNNDITATGEKGSPMGELLNNLPDFDDDDARPN